MFCPNTKDPPEGFVEDLKKVTKKKQKTNQNLFHEANNFHTNISNLTYSLEPKRNCSK